MKSGALFILLSGLIMFTSCEDIWNDCIEGNNRSAEEERPIRSFDRLQSTGEFDVYVTRADSFSLRLTGEENILRVIETSVRNHTLYIEVEDRVCLRNNLPIHIFITAPGLEELVLTGSGKIECDTLIESSLEVRNTGSGDIGIEHLETDYVEASVLGSGDIEIRGRANTSKMEVLGSGDIQAINFRQQECDARILGSGDIFVYVTQILDARITGSGNIFYKGTPRIHSQITGSGQILRY
jgi:hypothetical protein